MILFLNEIFKKLLMFKDRVKHTHPTFLYFFTLGLMKRRVQLDGPQRWIFSGRKVLQKSNVCYFFNFSDGFNSQCLPTRCSFIRHTRMISSCRVERGEAKLVIRNRRQFDGASRISEGWTPKVDMSSGWPFWCGSTNHARDHLPGEAAERGGRSLQYVNQVTFWPCGSWINSQSQLC